MTMVALISIKLGKDNGDGDGNGGGGYFDGG